MELHKFVGFHLFTDIEERWGTSARQEVSFIWGNSDMTVTQAFLFWRLLQQGKAKIRFEKIKKVADTLTKQDKKDRDFLAKHNL